MHIAASTLYDFVQCPTRVGLDAFGDPSKRDPINPSVDCYGSGQLCSAADGLTSKRIASLPTQ
jgi:hypothetical protein